MIIVDKALEARHAEGRPIQVALVGAGFISRGVVHLITRSVKGMRVAVIANRTLSNARDAYAYAGLTEVVEARSARDVENAVVRGVPCVTEDPFAATGAANIDVIVELTGHVEYGAKITMSAIENGKHVILMNAELDATIGSILKHRAEKAGVIVTGCDGDQPGVEMNLYRFVKSIGVTPMVCGNIKGLQDFYRTPATQKSFAESWGLSTHMATSFADGTKISIEQAIVANATGMTIPCRGMYGYDFSKHRDELVERFRMAYTGHVDDLTQVYDVDELKATGGIVDFVVGLKPAPGVYIIGLQEDPKDQHYLSYGKLGKGPLYSFYTPYHLCHFEVPNSIARVVLFGDAPIRPDFGPCVDVLTIAKKDLQPGDTLDGLGGFAYYGQCETYAVTRREGFIPVGLAEGCVLKAHVPKDTPIRYDDVIVPAESSLARSLRQEQDKLFPVA